VIIPCRICDNILSNSSWFRKKLHYNPNIISKWRQSKHIFKSKIIFSKSVPLAKFLQGIRPAVEAHCVSPVWKISDRQHHWSYVCWRYRSMWLLCRPFRESCLVCQVIMSHLKHIHTLRGKMQCLGATVVDCFWNVMTHAQKPDFVFQPKGRVHLNRRGRQFSRLLATEVCASAVVMLDTPCSEVVWRVLATHSIRQFPLQFPSRVSPCAIIFQMDST
jgi:hypothetical protein